MMELSRACKWAMYMLLFLIVISIYKDLSKVEQTIPSTRSILEIEDEKIFAVKRTVQRGDTLLSIMEEIHVNNRFPLQIEQVVYDFSLINDGQDPYELTEKQTYYFPLYMY